jgi:hypothetical protein
MFGFMKRWLRQSPRIHIRQKSPQTMSEIVALFDRFLFEERMSYPLEWDDFISWKNSNPNIEAIRERLGSFEALLFSRDINDKAEYRRQALSERNRAAALIGIAARE